MAMHLCAFKKMIAPVKHRTINRTIFFSHFISETISDHFCILRKRSELKFAIPVLCICLLGCSTHRHISSSGNAAGITQLINTISSAYAPDKRTVLFDVQLKENVLKGETTSAEAKTALMQQLAGKAVNYIDSISVLPSADLQGKDHALIIVSVANLRVQPSHKAELASQATMGTPVKLYKKEKGWYLVQTPDKYLAWVEGSTLKQMDAPAFLQWQQQQKLIYTEPYGFAYEFSNNTATVCDLVFGDVMILTSAGNEFNEVQLPGGRKAFIPKDQCVLYNDWRSSRQPVPGNIISSAKKMMGVPYLWGGTSFKGVDCSGFTKTVYFMNGLVLPRDASQQAQIGEEIDTKNGWQNLQPGDLLFFGSAAKNNKPEQVVHVGIWIGNGEFIHAAGMVQVASLDPAASNYDAGEYRRFLRAKRISPKTSLFDLRVTDIY
jgi:gamma-D-glutamyl-L-lysine dipeptidyl-peptidase